MFNTGVSMFTVLRTSLALIMILSISCSNGGPDGVKDGVKGSSPATTPGANKPGTNPSTPEQDNLEYKNVQGTIRGQWLFDSEKMKLLIYLNESKMKVIANCEGDLKTAIEIGVAVTTDKITFLESKVAGQGNCQLDFKKDVSLNYTLDGDKMTIVLAGDKQIPFTRVQTQAAPPPAGGAPTDPNAGGTAGDVAIELFSGVDCTGTKYNYTIGMNCTSLTGTVISYRQPGQQCNNANQAANIADVCVTFNKQAAGQ